MTLSHSALFRDDQLPKAVVQEVRHYEFKPFKVLDQKIIREVVRADERVGSGQGAVRRNEPLDGALRSNSPVAVSICRYSYGPQLENDLDPVLDTQRSSARLDEA